MKDKQLFIEENETENALLALNHIATIADDLYSITSDEQITLSDDEVNSILSAYEILSDIYERHEENVEMPSDAWDDIEIGDLGESVIDEATENDLEALLKKMDFVEAPYGQPNTYKTRKFQVDKLFGIKMRADKYADTFILFLGNNKMKYKYAIANENGLFGYFTPDSMIKALNGLSKPKKLDEAATTKIITSEVPGDISPSVVSKYRLEIQGLKLPELEKLIKKVWPRAKYRTFPDEDAVGFGNKQYRDHTIAELEKYFKNVKESSIEIFDLQTIAEEFDAGKFRKLAITGLVPDDEIAKIIVAMKNIENGKPVSNDQKQLIINTFMALVGLVTGDTTIVSKITNKLK